MLPSALASWFGLRFGGRGARWWFDGVLVEGDGCWEAGAEVVDAGGPWWVGGVLGGGFSEPAAVVLEPLPEGDGGVGVILCPGHVEQSGSVGIELDLVEFWEGVEEDAFGVGEGRGGAFVRVSEAFEQGFGGVSLLLLDVVVLGEVRDLMCEDGGDFGVGAGELEESGIDPDLSSGEGKGVGHLMPQHDHFPLRALLWGEVERAEESGEDLLHAVVGDWWVVGLEGFPGLRCMPEEVVIYWGRCAGVVRLCGVWEVGGAAGVERGCEEQRESEEGPPERRWVGHGIKNRVGIFWGAY